MSIATASVAYYVLKNFQLFGVRRSGDTWLLAVLAIALYVTMNPILSLILKRAKAPMRNCL